ncbi:hypothetical protein [Xanthomonas melonis]|uniref:hypothetical protein n=1 Tax=Xanthomonas melonis TaxID=56456 RepID=UPI003EB9C18F
MRERPILFKGDMVRAILASAKTQTRRVMKVQPVRNGRFWEVYGAGWSDGMSSVPAVPGHSLATNCPFGQLGDRLWVRETFSPIHSSVDGRLIEVDYRATYEHGHRMGDHLGIPKLWKPSIHMPRDACRLVLEITDLRVERLQAISEADAQREGAGDNVDYTRNRTYRDDFRDIWTSTGGDWDANPWVWAIGFRRTEQ